MYTDSFKVKLQESGRSCADFGTDSFLIPHRSSESAPHESHGSSTPKETSRMVSDQMINIFFQEWAPLFPVLHRPSFLRLYTQYASDPEALSDSQAVAQLNLVFGIAAVSAKVCQYVLSFVRLTY